MAVGAHHAYVAAASAMGSVLALDWDLGAVAEEDVCLSLERQMNLIETELVTIVLTMLAVFDHPLYTQLLTDLMEWLESLERQQ